MLLKVSKYVDYSLSYTYSQPGVSKSESTGEVPVVIASTPLHWTPKDLH